MLSKCELFFPSCVSEILTKTDLNEILPLPLFREIMEKSLLHRYLSTYRLDIRSLLRLL